MKFYHTFLIAAFLAACAEEEPFETTLPIEVHSQSPHGLDVDHNRNLSVHLDGEQERPNPVDTRAQGQAIFKLSNDGESLHFKLIVANIEDVRMAHLHRINDPVSATGEIVVWLYPDGPPPQLIPGRTNGTLAEGEITANSLTGSLEGKSLEDLIDAMNDGEIYVNVHTIANPPGEIRGDIEGENEPS